MEKTVQVAIHGLRGQVILSDEDHGPSCLDAFQMIDGRIGIVYPFTAQVAPEGSLEWLRCHEWFGVYGAAIHLPVNEDEKELARVMVTHIPEYDARDMVQVSELDPIGTCGYCHCLLYEGDALEQDADGVPFCLECSIEMEIDRQMSIVEDADNTYHG